MTKQSEKERAHIAAAERKKIRLYRKQLSAKFRTTQLHMNGTRASMSKAKAKMKQVERTYEREEAMFQC